MQAFVPIWNWKNASKCIKIYLKNSLTVPERHQNRYLLCISFPQLGIRKVRGVRESKISQKLMVLSFFSSFHVSVNAPHRTNKVFVFSVEFYQEQHRLQIKSNTSLTVFPPSTLPLLSWWLFLYPSHRAALSFIPLPLCLIHLFSLYLGCCSRNHSLLLFPFIFTSSISFFTAAACFLPLHPSCASPPPSSCFPVFLFFRPLIPNTLPCLYPPLSTMFSSKHLLLLWQNLILIISPPFSLSPPPFPRLHQACSRSSGAGMTWLSGYGGQRRSLPCAPSLADPSKWTVKHCCCSLRRTSATVRLTQVSISSFLLSSGRSACLQLPLNSAAKISD